MSWPESTRNSTAEHHLIEINREAGDSIKRTLDFHRDRLGKLLQLDIDIKSWEKTLSSRPEISQIKEGQVSLAHSIYAAAAGQYRHAYSGLRLFLELSFAAVYFSANELSRRRWLSDRQDFSWSRALDETKGILAKDFVQEFNPRAVESAAQYAVTAASCYRTCSQFLHGKDAVTRDLPLSFSYTESAFVPWSDVALKSAECVLFLIFCRYGDETSLADPGILATLEHSFSHIEFMREILGMPIEKKVNL
ncbi:hypothetical protein ACFQ68_40305 [Amycolatopsis japonica]|uniref:hypothetical protein n=1 Tax=Amycolatopsis japonica TaxID=208439 RepID=UPI00366F2B70